MSEGSLLKTNAGGLRKRWLQLIFVLLFTLCLTAMCLLLSFGGFIDFPCFVTVEDGILKSEHYVIQLDDLDLEAHAIIFATTHVPHMSGNGCSILELKDGEQTTFRDHTVEAQQDRIIIDGETVLQIGESFTADTNKRFLFNPWWLYNQIFTLTNHGFIKQAQIETEEIIQLDQEILIVIGEVGERESLNIITLIIFATALGYIVLKSPSLLGATIKHLIQKRRDKKEHANSLRTRLVPP